MSNLQGRLLATALLFSPLTASPVQAENLPPSANLYAERALVHILGPSPAIVPSAERSAVDSFVLESCDVIKDVATYYWYYHAKSKDTARWPFGYRICAATAPSPLGPWTKYAGNPVLDQGPEGSWDHKSVDGAVILKEGAWNIRRGTETFYMWYSGSGPTGRHIGLATASSPLGPWKKYEHNPILKNFGYLGGVVRVNGKFYLFAQQPVGVTDQGPFRVALADRPEGPWVPHQSNPMLAPGDWGAWDDGGYSEARVRYHEGVFHCFYGGTKTPKIESIGYAYSLDGVHWSKYGANPVVAISRVPDASGMAEVHAWLEGPYVYLYHTLRYFTGVGTARGLKGFPRFETEDLGVQVLTIDPRFKIAFPVLALDSLGPRQSSRIEECLPIGMEAASTLALTITGTFPPGAQRGLTLHLRGSCDGVHYDTADLASYGIGPTPGGAVQQTVSLTPSVRFLKVIIENRDPAQPATAIRVQATVGN